MRCWIQDETRQSGIWGSPCELRIQFLAQQDHSDVTVRYKARVSQTGVWAISVFVYLRVCEEEH